MPNTRSKDAARTQQQLATAAEERNGIKHSRIGRSYQSDLTKYAGANVYDVHGGIIAGDRVDDARAAPDELVRCLECAAVRGFPRSTVTEIYGTCVWMPGVLDDSVVDAYLRCTRKLVSKYAKYDMEQCLTLLSRCNYDVNLAVQTYAYMQNNITAVRQKEAAEEDKAVGASADDDMISR